MIFGIQRSLLTPEFQEVRNVRPQQLKGCKGFTKGSFQSLHWEHCDLKQEHYAIVGSVVLMFYPVKFGRNETGRKEDAVFFVDDCS